MVDENPESRQQTCKVCGCVDKFNFHVPDDVWKKVVPARHRNKVVCLTCFDKFASKRDVDYSDSVDLLYFAGDRAFLKFETVSAKDV